MWDALCCLIITFENCWRSDIPFMVLMRSDAWSWNKRKYFSLLIFSKNVKRRETNLEKKWKSGLQTRGERRRLLHSRDPRGRWRLSRVPHCGGRGNGWIIHEADLKSLAFVLCFDYFWTFLRNQTSSPPSLGPLSVSELLLHLHGAQTESYRPTHPGKRKYR